MPPMKRLSGKTLEHDTSRLRVYLKGDWAGASRHEFIYELPDAFTTETGGLRAYNRFGVGFTILEVHCSVSAAITGSAVIVDVNKNGTTIFTTQANRPQIGVGDYTGLSTAMDVTAFDYGDYFTVDVDQGSGSDLAVCILVG